MLKMNEKGLNDLEISSKEAKAMQRVAIERIIRNAKVFYSDPKNIQAFDAWLKNKESNSNQAAVNHEEKN